MTALKFKHIYCLTVLLVILALSNNLYADKERDAAEKSQISEAIHELSDTPTDQLLRLAKQVKAFLKGDLEGKPEISDLFDIDITNEDDVQLERTRLEILLKNKGSVTDPLLQARFALDEARLSFYALSQTQ